MSAGAGLAATAEHAARGKAAAVARGYWPDPFARHFGGRGELRSPGALINRGQYARIAAICSVCEQFLGATAGVEAQIVSLGAGFDTLFWQLAAAGAAPRLFIELDQMSIVHRKTDAIMRQPELQQPLGIGDGDSGGGDVDLTRATGYKLLTADLNDTAQLEQALADAGWRPEEPTLVIAECVLVYMAADKSSAVLRWFAERAPRAVLVSYEMIGPHDPFGRTMVSNLRDRGCPLLGLAEIPDIAAQEARAREVGWGRAVGMPVLRYYERVLSAAERSRIGQIELLDEVGSWRDEGRGTRDEGRGIPACPSVTLIATRCRDHPRPLSLPSLPLPSLPFAVPRINARGST